MAQNATNSTTYRTDSDEERMNDDGYGTSGAGPLTFPSRLNQEWRHIIHFQRYEYSRADARSTPTESRAGNLITLPIPENLSANYTAGWENESLGLVGNQMRGAADEVIRKAQNGGGLGALKDALIEYSGENLGQKVKNFGTALAIDGWSGGGGIGGSKIGQAISRAGGIAINPFKTVLYSAPDLRTFNFDYKFIISNLQEAETLRSIRKEFKLGMHPSFLEAFEDNIFKYPDVWRITIPDDEYLFKFMTCVLTGADFGFSGEGTKTYIRGNDKVPLFYTIRLSFSEVAILTKEEIEQGY